MSKISKAQLMDQASKRIYLIRGKRVMLDRDLADLYEVPAKVLNQAVKRNRQRFPWDFMFPLTREEAVRWRSETALSEDRSLRSQSVTLKRGRHIKYLPYAFTEQGVAMLSSVLNSPRAVQVNIEIMRIFVRFREIDGTARDLLLKIEQMEQKYDVQFQVVFRALKVLLTQRRKDQDGKRFET